MKRLTSVLSLVKGARAEVEIINSPINVIPNAYTVIDTSGGTTPLGFRCKHDLNWMPLFFDLDRKIRPLYTNDEWHVDLAYPAPKMAIVGYIYFVPVDSVSTYTSSIYLERSDHD